MNVCRTEELGEELERATPGVAYLNFNEILNIT